MKFLQLSAAFPTNPHTGKAIMEFIVTVLTQAGWSKEVFGIRLGLDEMIANAIKHGNQGQASKFVRVKCVISDSHFRVRISDEGAGFNPAHVPNPTDPENMENPSGRGVMMTRHYMHRMFFNRTGNSVLLQRRRSPESVDEPLAASA